MAEPFLGEIKFFSYEFAPRGWALCNGALLPINQNQALFSLLGAYFGGDGVTTFAVPDLRGRVPMHPDAQTPSGTAAGAEQVALTSSQLPAHSHAVMSSPEPGTENTFNGTVFANASSNADIYASPGDQQPLSSHMVSTTGQAQAHNNCQPSLVGNYCIAIQGIYPSRN